MAERVETAAAGGDDRVARLEAELSTVRERLRESEETIRAIRGGEVDAFVVQAMDGERVYSLRGSEHVYRAFVEQLRDGAVTAAEDNTIIYTNRRFLELLGLPQSRVAGTNLLDHVAPEDGYISEALLQRARQRDSFGELSLVGRDGNRVAVHMFAFSVDIEGVKTVCALVTDLTEINRYRYDFEQMVEARTTELTERAAELMRLSEAKNQLVARLAVELEKPVRDVEEVVAGVKPTAASLGHDEEVPLARSALALAENSVIRLNALLRDVSMLAEIESGSARREYTTVRLRNLALAAAEEARGPATEKGVDISVSMPEDDVSFVGDEVKIRQIIVALLLVCAESVEVGPVRLGLSVGPELHARFEVCAPNRGLPVDDIRCILGGSSDPDALRRISESIPAMSIWTARRMAHFIGGNLELLSAEKDVCFVFTIPM